MAQTADGKIAKFRNHLANWTSKEDKKHFIKLSREHRVIVMGETTFQTIGKPLPGRLNLILSQTPKLFKDNTKPGELEFFSGTPKEVVNHLESRGFKSAIIGGGAFVNASFLNAGLVDEIFLTVEGLLFGQGFGFCDGLNKVVKLEIIKTEMPSKQTLILRYKIIK